MRQAFSCAVLAAFVMFTFAGCGKMPAERMLAKGKKLEEKQKFKEAIDVYEKLTRQFPNNPAVATARYSMGNVYMYGLQDYPKAVDAFTKVIEAYPDTMKVVSQSQFLIGFIYNNFAVDTAKARAAYSAFLQKYPAHELANSVQWELDHLGKDINADPMFQK
jgi:TolA-binding protein